MTLTVSALRDGKQEGTKQVKFRAEAGGVFVLLLSAQEYAAWDFPAVGDVFEEERAAEILALREKKEATARALRLLAYADNSEHSLADKLTRAGVKRALAKETAADMVALGYLDEDRQLLRSVELLANRDLLGKKKICVKLAAKLYTFPKICRAIDTLVADGTVDFSLNREKLLTKKLGKDRDPDLVRKILYQNGYLS